MNSSSIYYFYLARLYIRSVDRQVPNLVADERECHQVPDISLATLTKLSNGEDVGIEDAAILWKVDFEKFHQDMR